jgi:heterodisulfide reductase subunit C
MSRLYGRELRPELYGELSELTFGFIGDLEKCMQCGKCVGNCPAASVTQYNSRRTIHAIKLGNIEEVIRSEELWSCFFCSACYASCPRDINFPFTVAMLRYASLYAGYAWDYVKKLLPFALDYYRRGMTVLQDERNPRIEEVRRENSGCSGSMADIRERMGLPGERSVSEKALSEIQFISDVSGMTKILKELPKKHGEDPESILDFTRVRTEKSSAGKFAGFPEEDDDAQE